ncbi:MAG: aryl-sulfate sulfotransferase [Bacteroidota bacterium]
MKSQIPPYHTTIFDSTGTTGYYFLVPTRLTSPNAGFHSQLVLDRYGDVVYYKSLGTLTNSPDFKVQPDGRISYFRNQQFYLFDSTFTIVDSVSCKNGITTDSHDFQVLPNGNFLLLGYETSTMDLSSYAWFKPTGTHGSVSASVKCNVVQELDINKNVVFEWHCKDYFAFADVDSVWLSNPNIVDWTHCNAIELDDDGNILLSSRHFNEIIKINRTDSTIMWRLGGVQNEFTFLNDSTPFYGQHDIRRIQNGNITLLDDGFRVTGVPFHACRAMEYQLDEINKTATVVWDYTYDSTMYSKATGNVERLPNGNTLVNFGMINSVKNTTFVVVDSLKNKKFEVAFIDTMSSYRSFNFQQLPWVFNRPQLSCIDSGGTYYLDAGAGYASYSWNDGSTNRFLPITSADTFSVFVPYGSDGGFISSEKIIVTNLNDPCGLNTDVGAIQMGEGVRVYPNPASEILTIDSKQATINSISIYNLLGKLEFDVQLSSANATHQTEIDVRSLSQGIYFIQIRTNGKIFTKKFVKN